MDKAAGNFYKFNEENKWICVHPGDRFQLTKLEAQVGFGNSS